MTQEEIVRLAKESGWQVDPEGEVLEGVGWHTCTDEVERFAALVIAAEREHCAKMLAEEGWLMAATLVRVKE